MLLYCTEPNTKLCLFPNVCFLQKNSPFTADQYVCLLPKNESGWLPTASVTVIQVVGHTQYQFVVALVQLGAWSEYPNMVYKGKPQSKMDDLGVPLF